MSNREKSLRRQLTKQRRREEKKVREGAGGYWIDVLVALVTVASLALLVSLWFPE